MASRTAWRDVYARIADYLETHKTILIFVPSRRLSERAAHDLDAFLDEKMGVDPRGPRVQAHHGALSKKTRLSVERRLQTGELRAVVATASLELGIDIGAVELVVQIGSPRALSVLRQRIGRAGHTVGGTPKGRLFCMTRDDLIESAAAVRAIVAGRIDQGLWLDAPRDILAQQLVAACGVGDWDFDALYKLCRRAQPYCSLTRAVFDDVLSMLGDGISTRRGRRSGAHLHLDRVNGKARARRGARLAALTSGGAIPDKADYQVVEDPSENIVGTLDEDFAIESSVGDVFLLGSTSWRVRRVESGAGRVRVENAHGAAPSVPFWNGEGLARTYELSTEVAQLRTDIASRRPLLETDDRVAARDGAVGQLMSECGLSVAAAEQAVDYVWEGATALGAVPTQTCLVAERFFDESGGMQIIIHAPLGARINRAFCLGLRKKFCRAFDFELQAAATDDAVLLSVGPQHSFPLETLFGFLSVQTARETLVQAALQSPMWGTRWRWNATRSLAVLRFTKGRRTAPQLMRMRSDDLMAAVFPAAAGCQDNHGGVMKEDLALPDHPLVDETANNCLDEVMDLEGLLRLLRGLDDGKVQTVSRDTVAPSPFAHAILASNPYAYMDDAPLEERRARTVGTARPGELAVEDLTRIDPQAIVDVVTEVNPLAPGGQNAPRDAEELHDYLCTAACVAPHAPWRAWLDELSQSGRASEVAAGGQLWWVATERKELVRAAYDPNSTESSSAAKTIVGGHLETAGPLTADALAAHFALPRPLIDEALAHLEADGRVLQGRFRDGVADIQFCERRILQRIHRRTLGVLREQIRPVTQADLWRFLARWQHVQPGTQLAGVDGLLHVIEQLEGWQAPAAAWEDELLKRRVSGYQPEWLDELCLSGEVAWARLTPARTTIKSDHRPRASQAPITLQLRAHAEWLLAERPSSEEGEAPAKAEPLKLSVGADRVLEELRNRGAAFVAELSQRVTDVDVGEALWELVRAGLVACDGFAGLRALAAGRAVKAGRARGRAAEGRWSCVVRPARAPGPFGDGSPVELARSYLRRYGVVCRTMLQREPAAPPWRQLLAIYRRLEARGEIRGGRFVSGLNGEQFALPEAVELLRAMRRRAGTAATIERVAVAAVDPLNLVGILSPGPRTPAVAGHVVEYADGAPMEPPPFEEPRASLVH